MAARRRQRISQVSRERLVSAFNDLAQEYLSVADALGVNCSTARGIIKRYLENKLVGKSTLWRSQ